MPSGHFNSFGNTAFLKTKFVQNLAAGEKLMGFEFEMTIDDFPDAAILVRSTQFPAMGRSDVEDFGSMGLNFTQHGALENKGEIAVTCVETITGTLLSFLRDTVKNKKYVDITIRATPESLAGISSDALKFKLLHCKIRSDPIDLATEDTAALVKPSMTIIYNWVDL